MKTFIMSTTRLELKKSIDKVDDENACASKMTRSVTHRRPASASGLRSKIPTIVNQNNPGSSMIEPRILSISPQNVKALISQGKPQRRFPLRNVNLSLSKNKVPIINSSTQRNLEKQFKSKKNRYLIIQSEIKEKQKNAVDIYEEMSELRKKIIASGSKDPGKMEGIQLIPDNSNKCEDENHFKESGEHGTYINASVTREFASILENELRDYPKECVNLCEEMIEKYSRLIEWTNNFCQDKFDSSEIIETLNKFKIEAESMKTKLETVKKMLDDSNGEMVRKIIMMWEEIEGSRLRIRDLENMSEEVVNQLRMTLNVEIEKFTQLEKQKAIMDNELKKTNTRIQKLEETINVNKTQACRYQEYIDNLETQLKQNDINFEHDTRDLHESLKNSEEMIISLESQRNHLESRLMEMKENLDKLNNNDMQKEVDIINQELMKYKNLMVKVKEEKLSTEEDLKNKLQKEKDLVQKLTEDYGRLQNDHKILEQKYKELDDQIIAFNIRNSQKMQSFSSVEFIKPNSGYEQEEQLYKKKNVDLEIALNYVQNKLTLQDQTLQEQHQRIQVQDELIDYLKNSGKNFNSDFNYNIQEINKEITAKSEAIQVLSAKLEAKDLQLVCLEKLVKQMEGEEEHAQERRTRLEQRIAQLELALQAKNNKDYRYVLDYSNSPVEKKHELLRPINSRSYQYCPLKMQNSKTHTTMHSPQYNSMCDYYIQLKNSIIGNTSELDKNFKKFPRKSRHLKSFHKQLIESKEISRHSHTSRCDNSHNSVVNPRRVIDVDSFAYQIVDHCGREIESLNSNTKCWSHSSKGTRHNKKLLKNEFFL